MGCHELKSCGSAFKIMRRPPRPELASGINTGTLRTIEAHAREHAYLDRRRLYTFAQSSGAGDEARAIAVAPDPGNVCHVGTARTGRRMAGELAAAGRRDRSITACITRRPRERRRPLDL